MLQTSVLIALGGALGSLARFWLSEACIRIFGAVFPWGILLVNITGCFVIGLFTILTDPEGRFPVALGTRMFVMIGICGGYTTFSSFSLQTVAMMQKGQWVMACGNILGSVALCLLATFIGIKLGSALNLNAAHS